MFSIAGVDRRHTVVVNLTLYRLTHDALSNRWIRGRLILRRDVVSSPLLRARSLPRPPPTISLSFSFSHSLSLPPVRPQLPIYVPSLHFLLPNPTPSLFLSFSFPRSTLSDSHILFPLFLIYSSSFQLPSSHSRLTFFIFLFPFYFLFFYIFSLLTSSAFSSPPPSSFSSSSFSPPFVFYPPHFPSSAFSSSPSLPPPSVSRPSQPQSSS